MNASLVSVLLEVNLDPGLYFFRMCDPPSLINIYAVSSFVYDLLEVDFDMKPGDLATYFFRI